jgi:para-nitrobenzyl esterase
MMNLRRAARVAALVLVTSAFAACKKAPPPLVSDPTSARNTPSGAVVGGGGEYDNHEWRGIPYAQAPLGELRWRAPQPPPPWSGTRDALRFGSPCAQYASPLGGVDAEPGTPVGSEDCLYANVYAPRFTPESVPAGEARLPVMVWIHGGGNTIGEGGFYNGGNLAASHKVIVVTFNYRLGPLGWFRHGALRATATNEDDRSGNFATLDLQRALAWVRDHISAFGGDPGNVTVFGESAGGQNVYSLLLSPKADGLFHRAIAQSGGLWSSSNAEAENLTTAAEPGHINGSNEVLLRLLIADELAGDRRSALRKLNSMEAAEVADYLRGKSSFEILAAYEPDEGTGMIDMPKVFRDGAVLPQAEPRERLARGSYNRVPVMLGTTRDENKLFMFGDPLHVRRTLWIFWRLRDERMYNLTAEYLAKQWKAAGADQPAAAMRAVQGPSVFVYRFDWDEEPTILGADLSVMLGAAHGFEIPFVFGHFNLGSEGSRLFTSDNEPGRRELSAQMMSYWAAFAYDGAPGRGRGGDLLEWKAWDPAATADKFLILDTEAGGGTRMSPDALTSADVLAAVDADLRFESPQERCVVLRALTRRWQAMPADQYAARCPEQPLAEADRG